MAIQDFGKKIGGARKDLWRSRGLRIEDLEGFNVAERDKYIKKNYIWPTPDYEKMINEEGYSRNALYFIKTVRDSIPTAPEFRHSDTAEEIALKQEVYIDFLTDFKEELLNVKTDADIDRIGIKYLVDHDYVYQNYRSYNMTNRGEVFINNKFFKALQMSSSQAEREAQRKEFLANTEAVIREQFKVKELDYHFYVENNYTTDDKICIRQDTYGGSNFYYTKNPDFINMVRENGLSAFSGNYLITRHSDILGITHDRNEAVAFVDRKAKEIFEQKRADKEAAKAEAKSDSNRKKGLVPPILAHIDREGPDVRVGDVTGQDFLDVFKIKGGEFGNWLNESERQTNMNMAFDSFKDMARALNINDEDISMGGKLNIAFGARGIKGAAAHYEPMREVINLTKMKGAGSLAHEFFHGMDDISGKELKLGDFATAKGIRQNAFTDLVKAMKYKDIVVSVEEQNKEIDERYNTRLEKLKNNIIKMVPDKNLTPELIEQRDKLIKELFDKTKDSEFKFREMEFGRTGKIKFILNEKAIKDICNFIDTNSKFYKMTPNNKQWLCSNLETVQNTYFAERATEPINRRVETEFYKNSKAMDDAFSKTTHGYWQSEIEMAARAFACYLHDKLGELGIKNDYLTGHAFQVGMNSQGEAFPVYPKKEEREAINKAFDKVIDQMKELGIFHERMENELAAETADKFIVAKNETNRVAVTMYDKNYNEIGTASMLPGVPLSNALKSAALGKEIKEMDYKVFEANKKEFERQQALQVSMDGISIDPSSYKQMSFEDMINQAKEQKTAQRTVASADVQQPETHQQKQFEIIQQTNSMTDDIHVGIRSAEDIKSFDEAIKDDESFCYGDFDKDDAEKALKTGMITVYSSKPIEQGGFVSTSYNMAKDYAGSGRVYAERVSINDVAWINGDEGQFARVNERELQRNEPSRTERKSGRDER